MTSKEKIKVSSWKELESHGKQTEQGLLIPMGVHGLSDTHMFFDEIDEALFFAEREEMLNKQISGRIVAIGIMY